MIIALDGPAGVGKSTIAKRIASILNLYYLNSGNFYRAITFAVLSKGIDPSDEKSVIEVAETCQISIVDGRIYLNGSDVEENLHTDVVDMFVASLSAIIPVRNIVNTMLRNIGKGMDIIVEGRDITTVVFPDADVKIFLDASVETRAKRRLDQGVSSLSFEELVESIKKRDHIDRNKPFGNLKISGDALYLDTSDLTIDEVCEKVIDKIK